MIMTNVDVNTRIELVDTLPLITNQIQGKIDAFKHEVNAFAIGNIGDIIRKHRIWNECFPRIEPFYAVKCNDVDPVIRIIADMGLLFDCASKIEIQKILDLGVDPSRIIYANTFKQPSFLKYAADKGVSLMTFDCEDELEKIKKVYPGAKLVLRISPQSNYKVKFHLGRKFGCHPLKASDVFQVAKKLKLNVIGVSFHVGSGCLETGAFKEAIEQSREVFDIGVAMGFNMHLLDIGGGFPGKNIQNVKTDITFKEIAQVVNKSLDKYFPGNDVRIIAEPGRYYVASAFTVAVNIITKKTDMGEEIVQPNSTECGGDPTTENTPVRMYVINDGIYGCLFECFVDPRFYVPSHFKSIDEELFNSTIWGPTCDGLDLIIDNVKLPELSTGDWIYFKDIGAYSFTNISSFNSMSRVKEFYICERKLWEDLR